MGEIIAVSTNKGGVLKTSLTTNIAGVLSQGSNNRDRKKVLILDSDNQGNVALSFGLNPDLYNDTLYDVMVDGMDIKNVIIEAYENIDLVISNDDMINFELDVLTNIKNYPKVFGLLKEQLNTIKNDYDYVLIDTPPNLGLTTGNVLAVTDKVLIPFQPESYSMRSLIKIIAAIDDFKGKINKNIEVLGIVPTLVDSRTVLHSEVLQQCRKYAYESELKMFETVIPRSVRFANSIAYEGKPATLTDKNNKLVQSYFELVKEMGL